MKRKSLWLSSGLVLLLVVLLTIPAPAPAEMYVEAYLGGVQGANAPMSSGVADRFGPVNFGNFTLTQTYAAGRIPGRLDPAVMGGLKIGTWFVKEGFLGMNYPDWMKYFGFYLDFMMHRLDFRRQAGKTLLTSTITVGGVSTTTTTAGSYNFWSEGVAPTLAFMFAARYGFLPDSEVPFGRLQPYLAVGPAILFASQRPAFSFTDLGFTTKMDSNSSAVICLAVEAGLRWMALKNVSIDVSFKYRYAQPSFSYTFVSPLTGNRASFTMDPAFHLFSGQVGAAYHF